LLQFNNIAHLYYISRHGLCRLEWQSEVPECCCSETECQCTVQ